MEVLALAGRVVLSLVVVLVLLWLAARGLRKGQQRTQHGIEVDVLARQPLAQRSSVAVVQVGERALVLGVTEHRVELLSEQPLADLLPAQPETDLEAVQDDVTDVALPVQVTGSRAAARTAARTADRKAPQGGLAGSALSPQTWAKAVDAVREMTVRR
ncbi:hypothetical protein GCM10027446_27860 [Angustibacter peucedani]